MPAREEDIRLIVEALRDAREATVQYLALAYQEHFPESSKEGARVEALAANIDPAHLVMLTKWLLDRRTEPASREMSGWAEDLS